MVVASLWIMHPAFSTSCSKLLLPLTKHWKPSNNLNYCVVTTVLSHNSINLTMATLSHLRDSPRAWQLSNKSSNLPALAAIITMVALSATFKLSWALLAWWCCMPLFTGPIQQIQHYSPWQCNTLSTWLIECPTWQPAPPLLVSSQEHAGSSTNFATSMYLAVPSMFWTPPWPTKRKYLGGNHIQSNRWIWDYSVNTLAPFQSLSISTPGI